MTRSRSLAVALLIAGSVLALAPSISSAQYRGRYNGGGRNWGVGIGTGYYGGGYGGYYGSGYGGYYGNTYPGYGYGYNPSYGYSNSGYYSPGYSLNWNSYPTYSDLGMNYSAPIDAGYYGNSDSAGGMGYQYGSLSGDMSNRAFLNVRLPAPDAEVWIEGDKTRSMGFFREYMSPALDPEKRYSYEIKVRWTENGKEVTRTKKVPVRPNAPTLVDFTVADRGDMDRPETDRDRIPGTDKDRKLPGSDRPRSPDSPPAGTDRPGTEPKPGAPDKNPDK